MVVGDFFFIFCIFAIDYRPHQVTNITRAPINILFLFNMIHFYFSSLSPLSLFSFSSLLFYRVIACESVICYKLNIFCFYCFFFFAPLCTFLHFITRIVLIPLCQYMKISLKSVDRRDNSNIFFNQKIDWKLFRNVADLVE